MTNKKDANGVIYKILSFVRLPGKTNRKDSLLFLLLERQTRVTLSALGVTPVCIIFATPWKEKEVLFPHQM